jgi:hypothetical protein
VRRSAAKASSSRAAAERDETIPLVRRYLNSLKELKPRAVIDYVGPRVSAPLRTPITTETRGALVLMPVAPD